jgi:hypothetical protein
MERMSEEKQYNGWTNYATWRVNLECVDGSDADSFGSHDTLYGLAEAIKEHITELVTADGEGLAVDYALAFLENVDWREIALAVSDGMYDEYGDLIEEGAEE